VSNVVVSLLVILDVDRLVGFPEIQIIGALSSCGGLRSSGGDITGAENVKD